MKTKAWLVPLILGISACVLPAQQPAKPDAKSEIAALNEADAKALETMAADYEKWFAALQTWYLAGLDKLFAETAERGDLDGVLAIKNERARIAEKKAAKGEEVRAMPPALRQLRATYDPAVKRINDESARRKEAAERKHLSDLEALQKRITMSGDIEQALLVKAERDRLNAGPPAARPVVDVAPAPRPPPPERAPPSAPPPAAAEVAQVPGTWVFSEADGKSKLQRYLNADGYFSGRSFNGNGRWKLDKGKVLLTYPDGNSEEMLPPLNPAGTSVVSKQGKKMTAVRESEQTPLPADRPAPSAADAAAAAAVKALVANSRWGMVPAEDMKATAKHWQEFYRDGTLVNSWGRKPNWEIIPPRTLHIFDAADTRHWYLEIDVAKKLATPTPDLDHNGSGMRYEKRVNTPPKSGRP